MPAGEISAANSQSSSPQLTIRHEPGNPLGETPNAKVENHACRLWIPVTAPAWSCPRRATLQCVAPRQMAQRQMAQPCCATMLQPGVHRPGTRRPQSRGQPLAAFEVVLRRAGDATDPGQRQSFELAAGEEIVFGRAAETDITIPDPERKVSSRHGKLRCDHRDQLLAFDLGSLNGTYLEGGPIDATSGTPVTFGSQLRVGDYLLEIANPREFETIRTSDIGGAVHALIRSLEDAYEGGLSLPTSARTAAMEAAVQHATSGMNRRESTALLETILDDANISLPASPGNLTAGPGVPPGPSNPAANPLPAASPASPVASSPAGSRQASDAGSAVAASPGGSRAAEASLRKLASQLVPGKVLESDEDFETFGQLLQQVCLSTLSWLAKGLQSRGVFAQEFGAEVTLVFQRSNNPLKVMNLEELTHYLLDWREDTNVETRGHYLEGVLKDMTEHQVGVIAGVKEAVAAVIGRLSPERIESLAENAKGWSKSGKVWATFQQVHKELSEEQSKLFHEMLTPAIQKGYLQQHGEDDKSSKKP
jgi:FHA domain-containing protein